MKTSLKSWGILGFFSISSNASAYKLSISAEVTFELKRLSQLNFLNGTSISFLGSFGSGTV
ncbi:MAG: hypothetical protein RLO81_14105 [Fulvivirga sp.]